jgi:hypothetical protein
MKNINLDRFCRFDFKIGEHTFSIQVCKDDDNSLFYEKNSDVFIDKRSGLKGTTLLVLINNDRTDFLQVILFDCDLRKLEGFYPSLLFIEKTKKLFIGAAKTILIFDIPTSQVINTTYLNINFWGWVTDNTEEYIIAEDSNEGIILFSSLGQLMWTFQSSLINNIKFLDGYVKLEVFRNNNIFVDITSGHQVN